MSVNGAAAQKIETNGSDPATGLREQTREALQKAGLSQARAAHEVGISDAALSQWLANKYRGDEAAVESKIQRWLDARAERAALATRLPEAPSWVKTPTAQRILAGLSYAQMAGDIAVVYGGAGLGKSVAARRYASSHPNVWVATMTAVSRSLTPCLERVAVACGLRSANARPWRLEAELVDRLIGSHGLLVIDEAQQLETRALEALRGLHDATGVGVALVGSEWLYARLTGGRRAADYAQLFSRIGKRVRLTRPTQADVEALLKAWSINGREERTTALEMARRPGGLRGVTKALRLASMFAQGDGEGVKPRHVRAAWRDLGGVA